MLTGLQELQVASILDVFVRYRRFMGGDINPINIQSLVPSAVL